MSLKRLKDKENIVHFLYWDITQLVILHPLEWGLSLTTLPTYGTFFFLLDCHILPQYEGCTYSLLYLVY